MTREFIITKEFDHTWKELGLTDDDLSELCNNFNGVAANVFKEVTVREYSPDLTVGFSTADPNCRLQKDVIC